MEDEDTLNQANEYNIGIKPHLDRITNVTLSQTQMQNTKDLLNEYLSFIDEFISDIETHNYHATRDGLTSEGILTDLENTKSRINSLLSDIKREELLSSANELCIDIKKTINKSTRGDLEYYLEMVNHYITDINAIKDIRDYTFAHIATGLTEDNILRTLEDTKTRITTWLRENSIGGRKRKSRKTSRKSSRKSRKSIRKTYRRSRRSRRDNRK